MMNELETILVRVPASIKQAAQQRAKEESRSLSAEVCRVLVREFKQQPVGVKQQ